MTALPDGRYDAFVIDAESVIDADSGRGTLHLELTIVAGDHKGEVVPVSAAGLGRDEIDVIGLPATLVVDGGEPRVTLDG
jgi:hypothetical protein